jgi:hypothetical protein
MRTAYRESMLSFLKTLLAPKPVINGNVFCHPGATTCATQKANKR